MIDRRLLRDLAETMFASDARGGLVGGAPHLHIIRTPDAVICRCRADLADAVADAVARLADRPRGRPSHWPLEYAGYVRALAPAGPPKAIRAGLLYGFPERSADGEGGGAIAIDKTNADLLLGGLDEWRPDVGAGLPMMVIVVDGRAVSLCASVNASPAAHCAGVETLPDYRGRGLAAQAVAGWAGAVQALGAAPFYGTTFDNAASQGVAKRLGLNPIGGEFSVECGAG